MINKLRSALDSLSTAADEAQALSLEDVLDAAKDGDMSELHRANDTLKILGNEVENAVKVLAATKDSPDEMLARSQVIADCVKWMKANGRESAVNAVMEYHLSFFTGVK